MENIVRLNPKCISCLIRSYLEACPPDADEAVRVEYMQRVLRMIAEAPASWGAPVLVSGIRRLRGEMFGFREDFGEIKTHFNRLMLAHEAEIEARILASSDPLLAAIQYAMIGNYIDFGVPNKVDEAQLADLLAHPERFAVREEEYEALKAELSRAETLVYLTDNCGEIVFDKLLIKLIRRMNPGVEVTVIVRGGPVLNDATMEDALEVGMEAVARVIGNGNDVAGTHMEALSAQAKAAITGADLILAKGQANHETLRHCGMNLFYIFLCKCELFSQRFGVEPYSGMLIHDSRC